jgi:hypothetical protein
MRKKGEKRKKEKKEEKKNAVSNGESYQLSSFLVISIW